MMIEGDIQRINTGRIKKRHRGNPAVQLLGSAKCRAKKFGLPFSITLADVVVPQYCPVLGTPLNFSGGQETIPSLDKMIPVKGYVPGNVYVISLRANRLKNDATLREIIAVANYMLAKHPQVC
jgi:hypothetical protein